MSIKECTCVEHWMLYINGESLNSTPEMNIIHVNNNNNNKRNIHGTAYNYYIKKKAAMYHINRSH